MLVLSANSWFVKPGGSGKSFPLPRSESHFSEDLFQIVPIFMKPSMQEVSFCTIYHVGDLASLKVEACVFIQVCLVYPP